VSAPFEPGAVVSHDDFLAAVRDAVDADGRTHAEIADALGLKGRGPVSKALSTTGGSRYAGTLADIGALLWGERAETVRAFRFPAG